MDEVGVYAAGLGMPVPGWLYLHHHLHQVPGERTLTATRVLVVCSACQGLGVGFVNRRLLGELVYRLEYLLLAFSVIPGWTPVVLLCQVTLQSSFVFSSPSFPWVDPCVVLFPHPIHLPPSCSPHSFFFVPSHL